MGLLSSLFGRSDQSQIAAAISEGAFLVDVRTPGEYALGSVPGAVNIPLGNLAQQLSKLKGKKNIVVFCRSGNRSSQAKSLLDNNGFQHVINGGTWQSVKSVADKSYSTR